MTAKLVFSYNWEESQDPSEPNAFCNKHALSVEVSNEYTVKVKTAVAYSHEYVERTASEVFRGDIIEVMVINKVLCIYTKCGSIKFDVDDKFDLLAFCEAIGKRTRK